MTNMEKIHNPSITVPTLKEDLRGLELREEIRIWKEIASSEARLTLMKIMIKEDLAFADLEEFGQEFTNKLKTINTKKKTLYSKVSRPAMKAKLADEQMWRRDLTRMKTKMRKDLIDKLEGEKTRRFKRVINHLNKVARDTKEKLNEKYKYKIEHLRNKYKNNEPEDEEVPSDLDEYSDLSIFNAKKFEEVEVPEIEIKTIGNITLSDEEKQVLKLHNKFSTLETVKPSSLDAELEASIAKLRMEKEKDKNYEEFTPDERKQDEEMEAKNRMIFDPTEKVFDNRKKRATDLKECARVTLPRPLSPDEESKLEVRKRIQKETFEKFRRENTNKRGEQKSNLTPEEKVGLKSLQKRIKSEEIIVLKTDKSGRFIVTTPEKYVEMGREHTKKDTEIEWNKVKEMERRVQQHTGAWEQIWRSGEDHNHQDRIIRSRATRSGHQANLTLLYKDHKTGDKTRPVASGNESYNQGLSNAISEVMESVARAIDSPYSVISSEDLLARVHKFNDESPSRTTSTTEPSDGGITTPSPPPLVSPPNTATEDGGACANWTPKKSALG